MDGRDCCGYNSYNQIGMIVSASAISFHGTECLSALHIENPTDRSLIFKMKITHTELFAIAPGKGIIPAHQKLRISVKINRLVDISAKLLISYAELNPKEEEEAAPVDQQWGAIDKARHVSVIIPITRTSRDLPEKKEEKKEERPVFKKTESPLYEMEMAGEEKQESNDNNSKRIEPLKKSLTLKHSSSLYRSVEDLDKRENNANRQQTQRLERELQEERDKNKKITERLIEREKKIMYLTDLRQAQINKSLNGPQHEEENNWDCCNVLLAAFFLIMIGFFLSKHDPQSP